MRGVIVHGALLVVMLIYGYRTWTRDKTVKPTTGSVVVWNRSAADLQKVEYQTEQKTVRIERRSDAAGSYWWGVETRMDKKPKLPTPIADAGVPAADAGAAAPPAAAAADAGVPPAAAADAGAGPQGTPQIEYEIVTTIREFPIGSTGDDVAKGMAAMRALRSLGALDEKAKDEYGLSESKSTLAVVFKDGTRSFVLGDSVQGGKERYAIDPDSGKGYILAGTFIDPLMGGEGTLKPTDPRGFDLTAISSVEIKAGDKTRTARRFTGKDDRGATTKTWADAATGKADQTLANYVDNIDKLRPSKYEVQVKASDMAPVVSVTYKDARGKKLGDLTLYKREKPGELPLEGPVDPTKPPPVVVEYMVITDRTRVPGVVSRGSAERIEQDIATLFPK